jgi:hypothetical protein
MDKTVLIQGLTRTKDGLEFNGGFPQEEYVGAIMQDNGEQYLVTRKGEDIYLKPCIIDASVEVTPNGLVTQAEFYFNREENTFDDSPATKELLETIAKTGKPAGNIEFGQYWDYRAYYVEADVYSDLKEMKASYPTRSIRDAVEMKVMNNEWGEKSK